VPQLPGNSVQVNFAPSGEVGRDSFVEARLDLDPIKDHENIPVPKSLVVFGRTLRALADAR